MMTFCRFLLFFFMNADKKVKASRHNYLPMHVCVRSNSFECACAHLSEKVHLYRRQKDNLSKCVLCYRGNKMCVLVCGLWSSWLESLGADRLKAWTSISAPPHNSVQLGGWAHYVHVHCIGFNTHTSTLLIVPVSNFVRSFIACLSSSETRVKLWHHLILFKLNNYVWLV